MLNLFFWIKYLVYKYKGGFFLFNLFINLLNDERCFIFNIISVVMIVFIDIDIYMLKEGLMFIVFNK